MEPHQFIAMCRWSQLVLLHSALKPPWAVQECFSAWTWQEIETCSVALSGKWGGISPKLPSWYIGIIIPKMVSLTRTMLIIHGIWCFHILRQPISQPGCNVKGPAQVAQGPRTMLRVIKAKASLKQPKPPQEPLEFGQKWMIPPLQCYLNAENNEKPCVFSRASTKELNHDSSKWKLQCPIYCDPGCGFPTLVSRCTSRELVNIFASLIEYRRCWPIHRHCTLRIAWSGHVLASFATEEHPLLENPGNRRKWVSGWAVVEVPRSSNYI